MTYECVSLWKVQIPFDDCQSLKIKSAMEGLVPMTKLFSSPSFKKKKQ